jgi:hypothetical protein
MNFRKSVKLFGGLRLNLSKKGIGVSAGVPGLRGGVGPKGITKTVSIPGTGIYSRSTHKLGANKKAEVPSQSTDKVYSKSEIKAYLTGLGVDITNLPEDIYPEQATLMQDMQKLAFKPVDESNWVLMANKITDGNTTMWQVSKAYFGDIKADMTPKQKTSPNPDIIRQQKIFYGTYVVAGWIVIGVGIFCLLFSLIPDTGIRLFSLIIGICGILLGIHWIKKGKKGLKLKLQ